MGITREELEQKLAEAAKEGDQYKVQYYQSQLNIIDQTTAADKALQEQASAVVTGFALPNDYDAYTGTPGINEEIIALIVQVSDQLNAVYLVERESLQAAHREALSALQANMDELAGKAAEAALELVSLKEQNYQLSMELTDSNSKRDAAAMLKDEAEAERDRALAETKSLKGQIDELEGLLRTYKKPSPASGGLKLTSTLKQETDEERKSRLQKQQLEVINRNLAEKYRLDPIKMPDEPKEVTPDELEAAFPDVEIETSVVRADTGGSGVQAPPEALAAPTDGEAGITVEALAREIASLKVRVTKLEGVA